VEGLPTEAWSESGSPSHLCALCVGELESFIQLCLGLCDLLSLCMHVSPPELGAETPL